VNNGPGSRVASIYGFPIGNRCVSKMQDFSYLFSSVDDVGDNPNHFNLAAANFIEDISRWDVSNAKTMRLMFASSLSNPTHFNQSLADWDMSNVRVF
jgi:hypothetical protein